MWDADLITGRIWLSERWAAMLGGPALSQETTASALFALVHTDDLPALREAVRAALKGDAGVYRAVHRVRRLDGGWLWIQSEGQIVARSDEGRALRALGVNLDVSALKFQEEALRAREKALLAITDNLPGLVLRCDAEERIVFANRRYAELFGVEREHLRGRHVRQVIGEEAYAFVRPFIAAVLRGEEAHYERGVGSRWLDVTFIPDRGEDGAVRGWYSLTTEITGRRKAEAAERVLEKTIAHLPQGVSVLDSELNMVAFNAAFLRLLDFPADRFRPGTPLAEFFRFNAARGEYGPGDPEKLAQDRLELARRGEPHRFQRTRQDGTVIEVHGMPVAGGGFVTLYSDVTAIKRQEQALIAAREAAEGLARAKDDFLANMSHEIRTPLHAILGLAGLLADRLQEPQAREELRDLREAGQDLMAMLNDVLDFTQLESGKLSIQDEPFPPRRWLEETLAPWRARAQAKGLAFALKVGEPMPRGVRGDAARLRQALANLVSNAVKFTAVGGIDVEAKAERGEEGVTLTLSVRDTGPGIDPDLKGKLFEPFSPAHQVQARTKGGTGLGLALAQKLLTAMGGSVSCRSELGRGTSFEMRVPLRLTELPVDEAPLGAAASRSRPGYRGRVLLAEDNPINRKVGVALLAQLGLEANVADDGEAALAKHREENFDLILMDLDMPRLDGLAATRALRAQERNAGRRVIILAATANVSEETRRSCLAAGMDGFVSKPFALPELVASFDRFLPRAAGPEHAAESPGAAPATSEAPELLDLERLAEVRDALGEDFEELLAAFLASTEQALEQMAAADRSENHEELRRLAHSLKSASANVGARALSALARETEFGARDRAGRQEERLAAMTRVFSDTRAALHAQDQAAEKGAIRTQGEVPRRR